MISKSKILHVHLTKLQWKASSGSISIASPLSVLSVEVTAASYPQRTKKDATANIAAANKIRKDAAALPGLSELDVFCNREWH